MVAPLYEMWKLEAFLSFLCEPNKMSSVLPTFKDNLLLISHLLQVFKSKLNSRATTSGFLSQEIITPSSAYRSSLFFHRCNHVIAIPQIYIAGDQAGSSAELRRRAV